MTNERLQEIANEAVKMANLAVPSAWSGDAASRVIAVLAGKIFVELVDDEKYPVEPIDFPTV